MDGRRNVFSGDDRTVVCEEHGGIFSIQRSDQISHLLVSRSHVAYELHMADAHDDVRRKRRDAIVRIDVAETGERRRMGRMKVNHRSGPRPRFVKGLVQEDFLGWAVARQVLALASDLAYPAGIEKAQTGVRGCHENTVINHRAYVACGTDGESTLEQ